MQQLPYVPARGIFRKLSERAFEHAGKNPAAPTVPKLFELAEKTPEFYRHFNQKVKKFVAFLFDNNQVDNRSPLECFILRGKFRKKIIPQAMESDMKKLIEYGTQRLAAATEGKDFFQAVPGKNPQGDLTAWYLRNIEADKPGAFY